MKLDPGSYIWATRGRHWGFRFLRDGGYVDPLPIYEAAFSDVAEERVVTRQIGDAVVLRFPDPEGRHDHARRPISHDFVIRATPPSLLPPLASLAGIAWATVSSEYERIWDAE